LLLVRLLLVIVVASQREKMPKHSYDCCCISDIFLSKQVVAL